MTARDDNGDNTPLILAAWANENVAVVEALLVAGADLEATNGDGGTPLYFAALSNENPAVPRRLLAAGADIEARSGTD